MNRTYQKIDRTPEKLAELKAIREWYQTHKPSPEEVLAKSGHATFVPLGQLIGQSAFAKAVVDVCRELGVTVESDPEHDDQGNLTSEGWHFTDHAGVDLSIHDLRRAILSTSRES